LSLVVLPGCASTVYSIKYAKRVLLHFENFKPSLGLVRDNPRQKRACRSNNV